MSDLEKRAPQMIEDAFREGNYEKVLEIRDSTKNRRFINKDWEMMHGFTAAAAFVLAGGLSSHDKGMLKRAKYEANMAMTYGASSDLVAKYNYCFTLALLSHILYPLCGRPAAFGFMIKAREIYPNSSDLVAADAALCVQAGEYENGIKNAILAITLAKQEERPMVEASAHYYLSLAYKGLSRNNEAREQMEIASRIMEKERLEDSSSALEHCVVEANRAIQKM